MRIAIAGSSGLIGTALSASLVAQGHDVFRLVRRTAIRSDEISWDPTRAWDGSQLEGFDAAINLAGVGVGDHRWTRSYKQKIRDSRVITTTHLSQSLAALENKPKVLLNASAIGWYGNTGSSAVDEDSPRGTGFLSTVCAEWEAATTPAEEAGIRVVHLRTGLVVSGQGGAWQRLIPLFKLGVGGKLGSGQQYWSSISIVDQVRAIEFCLTHNELSGAVNLTSPEPLTNAELTQVMGKALDKPAVLPVPGVALRLALGEFAVETLDSQRVLPKRLLAAGFVFEHPTFEQAFTAALQPAP